MKLRFFLLFVILLTFFTSAYDVPLYLEDGSINPEIYYMQIEVNLSGGYLNLYPSFDKSESERYEEVPAVLTEFDDYISLKFWDSDCNYYKNNDSNDCKIPDSFLSNYKYGFFYDHKYGFSHADVLIEELYEGSPLLDHHQKLLDYRLGLGLKVYEAYSADINRGAIPYILSHISEINDELSKYQNVVDGVEDFLNDEVIQQTIDEIQSRYNKALESGLNIPEDYEDVQYLVEIILNQYDDIIPLVTEFKIKHYEPDFLELKVGDFTNYYSTDYSLRKGDTVSLNNNYVELQGYQDGGFVIYSRTDLDDYDNMAIGSIIPYYDYDFYFFERNFNSNLSKLAENGKDEEISNLFTNEDRFIVHHFEIINYSTRYTKFDLNLNVGSSYKNNLFQITKDDILFKGLTYTLIPDRPILVENNSLLFREYFLDTFGITNFDFKGDYDFLSIYQIDLDSKSSENEENTQYLNESFAGSDLLEMSQEDDLQISEKEIIPSKLKKQNFFQKILSYLPGETRNQQFTIFVFGIIVLFFVLKR